LGGVESERGGGGPVGRRGYLVTDQRDSAGGEGGEGCCSKQILERTGALYSIGREAFMYVYF
jgi:hypothetical protein